MNKDAENSIRNKSNINPAKEELPSNNVANSLVRPCQLLPGDILLYMPRQPNLFQLKIASETKSPYTHAAIYMGKGFVAEATFPFGVQKDLLNKSIRGSKCVAVLRSQMGFGNARKKKLEKFLQAVIGKQKFYDFIGAASFQANRKAHLNELFSKMKTAYGKVTSMKEFVQRRYFCSALVVASYSVVGVIGDTAQTAYPPEAFSPGCLYRDPTFGWFLGYVVPNGGGIPVNDPLLQETTMWCDQPELQWWSAQRWR